MSFLSTLLKSKQKQDLSSEQSKTIVKQTKSSLQGYPSGSGLYPHEIVLLSMAEKYKTNETRFPDSLRTNYGIGFPKELFSKLAQQGYICAATAFESLNNLKLVELKAIAESFGIKAGGKKADLCEKISQSIPEQELEKFITEKYWRITEKGREELKENSYLELVTEQHPYSLHLFGIDAVFLNKIHHEKPQAKVRDIVWGELNKRSISEYQESFKSKNFFNYCEVLRTMALFLEEEHKHQEALRQYCHYLHYNNDFRAGFAALNNMKLLNDVNESSETLYLYAQILPFHAVELQRLAEENDLDSKGLQAYLLKAITAEQDAGIFSPERFVTFIMAELSGDASSAKKLALNVVKDAKKRLK